MIDTTTGASTVIGSFAGVAANITEIEWSPDGLTLYATTGGGASTIHTIDPSSGTVISSVLQDTPGALNGLEFDGSGTLLGTHVPAGGGSTPSTLMRVNPTTGVLTPIGLTGVNNIGGIAFDTGFSTLYGIESGAFVGISPKLYTIDPATGAVTFAVLTGIPVEVSSLEYYNSELIAGGTDDNLYRIDPATGVATVIGAMGASGGKVSGLSFRSVSLPASRPLALSITIAVVAALGGLTIAARARKSKSA